VLACALRIVRALQRLRRPRPAKRWAVVAAAILTPSVAVAALVVPIASAHRGSTAPPKATPTASAEPTPAAEPTIDPAAFAAAARRPAASAPLQRLPQVDLAGLNVAGIPRAALAAYVTAARALRRSDPACHLQWWVLAGIGYVESGHAHSGGSAAARWNGIAKPPILGPVLDGTHGFAAIKDTDHGLLDRDRKWDRAVGPMQFLPSTWRTWGGTDAHGRPRDPQDIRAAALAAGAYLCAGSTDLSQQQGLATAVYSYNHSFDYVRLVLSVAARYAGLDPNALGVSRLPRDQPAKKPGAKAKPTSGTATASPASSTQPGSSGGGASPAPSTPPSTAPSPSPTTSGVPSLPPVPTPTSLGG